jgi:hypothetical protein
MNRQRVMSHVGRVAAAAWLAALVVSFAPPAKAQSPAGVASRVNVTHDAHQYLDKLAVAPDGRLYLLWEYVSIFGGEEPPYRLLLREYSPEGAATEPFVIQRATGGCCFEAQMAANANGNLVTLFTRGPYGGFSVRRYGFSQGPEAFLVPALASSQVVPEGVAVDQAGGFVAVWSSSGQEASDQTDGRQGLFGRRFDATGRQAGPDFHVNTYRKNDQTDAALAMARDTGAFVATWISRNQDGSGWGGYAQLFGPDGRKQGGEILVPTSTVGDQVSPAVAMSPGGDFIIAWNGQDPRDATRTAIFAQRFAADGRRLGGEFRVSETAEGYEDGPQVAMDPKGNFMVTWDHWPIGLAYGRLYRADGTPVRDPIQITFVIGQLLPQIGFADNGTFTAAWTDALPLDFLEDVYVQRFSASPGEEFCLFRRGELVCDTGRTGGDPEIQYPFGGEAGETGLLGDVDGDGRADLCLFRAGVFRCDTGHDFGSSETRIRFGQAGDIPLLGDVNGDGKADPCVYRAGSFLCDTAHDGSVNVTIAFGEAGDVPLLGDIDGDGKADPCVFRAGMFLCDTAHDGSVNVMIAFGQAGDVPLLGDFDGDGRADPCVYRSGKLLCNIAHQNGATPATLIFGNGDGVPLLGNLDGL